MRTDWITCPDCTEDHEGITLCSAHRPAPAEPQQHDPNEVMQALSTEDCIDIVWSVLEGGDALALALEIFDGKEA